MNRLSQSVRNQLSSRQKRPGEGVANLCGKACASKMGQLKGQLIPEGGGGVLNKVFIRGESTTRSKPLTFLYTICNRKETPLVYILLTNGTLFTYLALEAREKLPGDEVTYMGFSDI